MATFTAGTALSSTTNTDTYAFTALTPAVGDLLVCFVKSGETTASTAITSDVGGIGFTKIAQTLYNTSADFCDVFVANQLVTSAVSHTLTWTCTGDNANGGSRVVGRVSGMSRTGLDAVRQFKEQENQSAGTPAPAFDTAALTGNLTFAVMVNATNPATMTTPSGWTERHDVGYNTPPSGLHVCTRDSGFTGTTVTWGSASASVFGAVIVELDTSVPPSPPPLVVARR